MVEDSFESNRIPSKMRLADAHYRFLYENCFDGIMLTKPDGTILAANPKACLMLGMTEEEIIAAGRNGLVVADEKLAAALDERKKNGQAKAELTFRRKDETTFPVEVASRLFTDDDGDIKTSMIFRDITERKQAEEAYRVLVDSSLQGLIIFQNSRAVFANETYAKMVGYTLEEMLAMSFEEIQVVVHPDDRAMVWSRFRDRLNGKIVPESYEFRIIRKDGSIIWVEMHASLTKYKGKLAIQVAVVDRTKRKQAEDALRESESKLSAIIEFLPDATFVIDNKKMVIAWNRAMEEMTGISRDKMIGQGNYSYTIPFYGERRRHLLDLLDINDKDLASKYQYVKRKGSILCAEAYAPALNGGKGAYVWATGAPIFDNKGNCIGSIESIRDITERKRAERSLQEQLNFLSQLTDSISSPIFYKDIRGVYLGCNKAFETLIGLTRDQIIGSTVFDLYPKDLADIYSNADSKLFQNPGVQIYEATIAHADGNRHDVMFNKATYFDTEGNLAGLVGVILDITERKQMENALRDSRRRLADIINFLPDATFVIDNEGKIIAWNRAVESLTGIWAEYMLGKGNYEHALPFYGQRRPILIDLVLRPQEEVEKEYFNLKMEGGALVGEAYVSMLGGGNAYLLGVASALYDSQGNIVGAIESIKDITERKRSEEILKASLQEKEVLLKEVHHRVKNNLQIISSILNIQASYIHDEDTRNALTESRSRVKSMALIHESLYRSENLARVNFADYIRNLLEALISSYNADKMRIRPILDLEEVFLEIDQAIPCGLILNEIITNCVKHAFPEGIAGEIQMELHSSNGMVMLVVKDDGIGLPRGFDPKSTNTMGLKLVSMLVKQLKGNLEINSEEGTEFRIEFPMI